MVVNSLTSMTYPKRNVWVRELSAAERFEMRAIFNIICPARTLPFEIERDAQCVVTTCTRRSCATEEPSHRATA